jgi:Mlc titration factor MtfA (ptsG expression regulator)
MLFSWLKKRRRAKLLAQPFPSEWLGVLERRVAPYRAIAEAERLRLRGLVRVFIAEKHWEGCNGLTVTDEMKVVVAGYACTLLLGLEHDYFSHVLSVLIYPTDYIAPARRNQVGAVLESDESRHGEAWYRGPVILSWQEIEDDITHPWDGQNLILHEFAHQLDMLDREVNGTPPLHSRELAERWNRVMTAEFDQLIHDARRGRPTLIDPYGTTNEAEFFAVTTECFFDAPKALREHHPDLYDLLREYYGQNPAEWRLPGQSHRP